MAQTPLAPSAATRRPGTRIALRTLAIASTLPYIALKAAWIFGSRIGIPDGSPLLDHRTTMIVANGITVLMDSAVVVIALLLTQAWGRRVPTWLLVLPMWVASGLLLPIMTGYPLQLVVGLVGGDAHGSGGSERPFLDEWVFGVVYTGFIVQGLTLGTLFALYAGDRWGHLWQGTLRDLPESPTGPALRIAATAASLLALVPGTLHLLWATGSTAGLNESRIAERNDGFYVLEAVDVLFAAAAVAGVLLLAFRRRSALPLTVPLALAWGGSGAMACWGGWLSIASLTEARTIVEQPTAAMMLIYAVEMLVGTLVVTLGTYFFAERAAAPAARPAGSPT
ncbi:hypothetical protein [Streptomyces atratus]|uniref:hypothetical protein n=1 Tax=Streptomyces atratus TaxID=1893 RepID=UPI00224D3C52|nr:hypothetical protein [Streptomyces atratus]MCX5344343.1 hypothetical protein [Streptomyces atratus]